MSRPEPLRRSDSFRPVLGVGFLAFLALLALASLKSSRDLEAAHGRARLLETRIRETESRIEQLHGRIDRLRHDPGTLERLAREDLGMVRPGDVVLVLPAEGAPAEVPAAATPAPVPAAPPTAPVASLTTAGPP